jgi:glycine hydroxymethyltransferase
VEFEHFGTEYAGRVVRNAQLFEAELAAAGFDTVPDGDAPTGTHQVWVRAGDAEHTNALAETLYGAGIRVNVQVDLPGVDGPVLRLGVNEVTFDGAGPVAMHLLADAFACARDRRTTGLVGRVTDVRAALDRPCYLVDFGADPSARTDSLAGAGADRSTRWARWRP